MSGRVVTRFAPSPTGYLHLGHAYSALFAEQAAASRGRFLLRIEDIDPVRCRPEYAHALVEDLGWLGLVWEPPVRFQSLHMEAYRVAFETLREMGVVYPCFCTRREVMDEVAGAGHAPHHDPLHLRDIIYPGTCRDLSPRECEDHFRNKRAANWRLDVKKALAITGPLEWNDMARGTMISHPEEFGDVILVRKDVPTSYHLSVTVDDYLQGVTLVTRGEDLLRVTDIHRLLQTLLGYATPSYHHHALLTDAEGHRLAKRDKSVSVRSLREAGKTKDQIREMCWLSSRARNDTIS